MTAIREILVFFALSVCVAYASGKTPCCFQRQFYAKITIVSGVVKNGSSIPEFSKNELMVDYDRNMRRERAIGNFTTGYGPNKTTTSYKAWNDYTSGKRYAFNSFSGTKCIVSPLPQSQNGDVQFEHCIPGTLQWQSTYVIGSGEEAVKVNLWEGIYQNLRYAMVATEKDCTLVSITRYGSTPDGTRFVENQQFAEMVQGRVSSTGALDIPKECLSK